MVPMPEYSARLVPSDQDTRLHARRRIGFRISLLLVVLCLGIALSAGLARASAQHHLPSSLRQEICGDIAVHATWTASESPYYVTCDTTLLPAVTLEIEPYVQVRFSAGVALTISGTLHATGALDQPITFTSDLESPAPGDWGGLRFVAGSSDSELTSCVVEYATVGVHVYAGPGETVGPVFSNCALHQNAAHGVLLEGYTSGCDVGLAQATIAGCFVEHNGGCGIHGYGHGDSRNGCSEFAGGSVGGAVIGSTIQDNGGPGICLHSEWYDFGHGDAWIGLEANAISGNAGHGIYLYGDDRVRPRTENNLLYGNGGSGIYSDARHEETELSIVNNTVFGNTGDGVVFKRPAGQAYFANNIVASSGGFGLVCDLAGGPQTANNDLWLNTAGDYADCTAGSSDISADPRFVAAGAGDFHLPFGSPCVDAGTSDGAPAVDIEGIQRPQGAGVDIGAHELWYQEIYLPLIQRVSVGLLDGDPD